MRLVVALIAAVSAALALAGAAAARTPNDAGWVHQWAVRHIEMPDVWDVTTGDPSIVIATVDTGVSELPDLRGALVPGWDFVENDAVAQDTMGHGTWIASVIAARGDNGLGIAGHCWACKVMPVRVSAGGSAPADRIAAGIVWAVDHGARIVNVSFSRPGEPDFAEQAAVKYALDRGVLVVAGAGNAGNTAPRYPAAYPGVLAVGATNDFDDLYFWSTRGPWVQLTAPGCQAVLDLANEVGTICGTSFTPSVVSGIAGLILSLNPSLTAAQVAQALTSSAKPVPGIGAGRVDPMAALSSLGLLPEQRPAPAPPPPPAPPSPPSSRGKASVRYAQELRVKRGKFRALSSWMRIGSGRLEIQVQTPRARECVLSVTKGGGDILVALPAVGNLLSVSAVVPAGRYSIYVDCWPATRKRPYTLAVSARFLVR